MRDRILLLVGGVTGALLLMVLFISAPAQAQTCTTDRQVYEVMDHVTFKTSLPVLKIGQRWSACWDDHGRFTSISQTVTMKVTPWGILSGVTPDDNAPPYHRYGSQTQHWAWYGSFRVHYPYKTPIAGVGLSLGGRTIAVSPAAGGWLKTFNIHATDVTGGWGWYRQYSVRLA